MNNQPISSQSRQSLISIDSFDNASIEIGGLLTVVVVKAANVVNDVRENIKNLVGGRMVHYEKLIQAAVDTALDELDQKARDLGYDGVIGVKISNPVVVNGGAEIIVYGNGFKRKN